MEDAEKQALDACQAKVRQPNVLFILSAGSFVTAARLPPTTVRPAMSLTAMAVAAAASAAVQRCTMLQCVSARRSES